MGELCFKNKMLQKFNIFSSKKNPEVVDVEDKLEPCGICGRTFLPAPLAKHTKVCQRNATRKRKVFNSLKQRIEGTDIAPFHQPSFMKQRSQAASTQSTPTPVSKKKFNTWREKHDELITTIRAARGTPDDMPTSPKPSTSTSKVGAEKCPSCERFFGIRAFDRHVEWCKDRKYRIQRSPAEVSAAKERLEARINYRVPPPSKSKRIVREKYSPITVTRTESIGSLKSVSCSNLERKPSVRKVKNPVVQKKSKCDNDASEPLYTPSKKQTEKNVPKSEPVRMPVLSGSKSPIPTPQKTRQKLNTLEVNSGFEGISVKSINKDEVNDKESKKMLTWKDTVNNSKSEKKVSKVTEKKRFNKAPHFPKSTSPLDPSMTQGLEANLKDKSQKITFQSLKKGKCVSKSEISLDSFGELCEHSGRPKDGSLLNKPKANSKYFKVNIGKSLKLESSSEVSISSKLEGSLGGSGLLDKRRTSSKFLNSKAGKRSSSPRNAKPGSGSDVSLQEEIFHGSPLSKKKTSSKLLTVKNSKSRGSPKHVVSGSASDLSAEETPDQKMSGKKKTSSKLLNAKASTSHRGISKLGKFESASEVCFEKTLGQNGLLSKKKTSSKLLNIKTSKTYGSPKIITSGNVSDASIDGTLEGSLLGKQRTSSKLLQSKTSKSRGSSKNTKPQSARSELSLEESPKSERLDKANYRKNSKHYVISKTLKFESKTELSLGVGSKLEDTLTSGVLNKKKLESKTHTKSPSLERSNIASRNVLDLNGEGSDCSNKLRTKKKSLRSKDSKNGDKNLSNDESSVKDKTEKGKKCAKSPRFNNINLNTSPIKKEKPGKTKKSEAAVNKKTKNQKYSDDDGDLGPIVPTKQKFHSKLPTLNKKTLTYKSISDLAESAQTKETVDCDDSNEEFDEATFPKSDLDNYAVSEEFNDLEDSTFNDIKELEEIQSLKLDEDELENFELDRDDEDNFKFDYDDKYSPCPKMYDKEEMMKSKIFDDAFHLCVTEKHSWQNSCEETSHKNDSNIFENKTSHLEEASFVNYSSVVLPEKEEDAEACHFLETPKNDYNVQNYCSSNLQELDLIVNKEKSSEAINIFNNLTDNNNFNAQDNDDDDFSPKQELDSIVVKEENTEDYHFSARSESKFNFQSCSPDQQELDSIVEKEVHEKAFHFSGTSDHANFNVSYCSPKQELDSIAEEVENEEVMSVSASSKVFIDSMDSEREWKFPDDEDINEILDENGSDVVVLHKPLSPNNAESLCGEEANQWNEALSVARADTFLRRSLSDILVNDLKTDESRILETRSETNLAHAGLSSDRILELAGEQFLMSLQDDDPSLCSPHSQSPSEKNNESISLDTEPIPKKRRKISNESEEIESQPSFDNDDGGERSVAESLIMQAEYLNNQICQEGAMLDYSERKPSGITPRLMNIVNSIVYESEHVTMYQDSDNEETITISKDHCRRLLTIDPRSLNLPETVKLPQIVAKKSKSEVRKKPPPDQFKLPPIEQPNTKKHTAHPRRSDTCMNQGERIKLPEIKAQSVDESNYDPFISAKRQLMELLEEFDDFEPEMGKSPIKSIQHRPYTSSLKKLNNENSRAKLTKSADDSKNKKRASVIDPPLIFQDGDTFDNINNLMALNDFELMESLVNQNCLDLESPPKNGGGGESDDSYDLEGSTKNTVFPQINDNVGECKYNDDSPSIDPRLINETDNLTIPKNLVDMNRRSLHSSNDNVANLDEKPAESNNFNKLTNNSSNISSSSRNNNNNNNNKKKFLKSKSQLNGKDKSTVTSSFGATRNSYSADRRTNLSMLKKSIPLADPVKPKNLKNKQDVQNYFNLHDRKISSARTYNDRYFSDEQSLKNEPPSYSGENVGMVSIAGELFSVDSDMYDEYKKYEDVYLREKELRMAAELAAAASKNQALADSAYSSLNRSTTPKVRARLTKLTPLMPQDSNPTDLSPSRESETSPTFDQSSNHRMSKFCHECGNRFPIDSAKFCVECGIRRLVL